MVSRILSTLLLWGVVLGGLWFFGPHAAVFILTVLAALTLHEFYLLAEKMGFRPFRWMSLTFSVLLTAGPYYLTEYVFEGEEFAGFGPSVLALAIVAFCIRILGERDTTNRIESLIATVIGIVYVPFMLHFLVRLLLLYSEPTVGLVVLASTASHEFRWKEAFLNAVVLVVVVLTVFVYFLEFQIPVWPQLVSGRM